jgi:methylamine--corrinoid protein Co-methyltransferase
MEASHSAAGGRIARHASGLDAKICGEVVHAVAGMGREQANELVKQLIPLYLADLPNEPSGKPFEEVYDVEKIVPTPEWQGMYDEVRNELLKMGIPIGKLNYSSEPI